MSQEVELRAKLEKAFGPDACQGTWNPDKPASGHCAVVALAVQKLVGGELASVMFGETSHWFNHNIKLETEHLVDIDFTGDQFGYPKIHVALAGRLYWKFRVRQLSEVNEETMKRFEVFWNRLMAPAGAPAAASGGL